MAEAGSLAKAADEQGRLVGRRCSDYSQWGRLRDGQKRIKEEVSGSGLRHIDALDCGVNHKNGEVGISMFRGSLWLAFQCS